MVNRTWQGEASRYGDSVLVLDPTAVTVSDYVQGTDLTYQSAAPGTGVRINLDQQKSWSLKLEDVDAFQSRPNVLDAEVRVAASTLASVVDAYVRDLFHAVPGSTFLIGTTSAKTNLAASIPDASAALFRQAFARAAMKCNDAGVPEGDRFAVLGPVAMYIADLVFSQNEWGDRTRETTLRNGFAGTLNGFRVHATNAPKATTGSNLSESMLFGSTYACGFINQMQNVERLRLEGSFADGVRGLQVYGGAIVESDSILQATINYSGLPALT